MIINKKLLERLYHDDKIETFSRIFEYWHDLILSKAPHPLYAALRFQLSTTVSIKTKTRRTQLKQTDLKMVVKEVFRLLFIYIPKYERLTSQKYNWLCHSKPLLNCFKRRLGKQRAKTIWTIENFNISSARILFSLDVLRTIYPFK